MPNVFLTDDYLVRLISQMVAALQAIIGLKAAQQYRQAGEQVDEALEGQFGLRASLLKELDDTRLKDMLSTGGRLELQRYLLVADLFRESSDLARLRGDEVAFRRDGSRALRFYQEAARYGGATIDEALPAKIEALRSALAQGHSGTQANAAPPPVGGKHSSRGITRHVD